MSIPDLIAKLRPSIAQIILLRKEERVGFGTAFLVKEGLITSSRNIRSTGFDSAIIRFYDSTANNLVRLDSKSLCQAIIFESPEKDKDYICLKFPNHSFSNRPVLDFSQSPALHTGEHVLFLGFAFTEAHLTSHIGFVSALFQSNGVETIQVDGSFNSGFSGAPLIDLKTSKVAAIITRVETAAISEQFNNLAGALRRNQIALERFRGTTLPGRDKIDPIEAIKNSQAAMEQIVRYIRQSASVGTGFAVNAKYIQSHLKG